MKQTVLERILNGDIAHIKEIDMYESTFLENEVPVFPKHVKKMLLLYLDKKINEGEINSWADFLCSRSGEYVCINWEDDESCDFYEDMWYVVQKLSTPEIDGEITPETVREYLKELDKYF